MGAKPVISVVIPAYNAGAYLSEAIDSALQQESAPEEILVIDDGSTDNTQEAARAYAQRILYIRQSRSGPATARNRGIREARGDWIAFLDGDDVWMPWHLGETAKVMARYPEAALLCGRTIDIGESACRPEDRAQTDVKKILIKEFIKHNPVPTSTVLARKDAIMSVGGFDVLFRGPEDYDLWMRLVKKYSAFFVDTPHARYRSLSGSLSMDERTFLPQVLMVLERAFEEGGSLREYYEYKNTAYARQYWSASWMAFERGDRATALRYLFKAYVTLASGKRYPENIDFKWARLFIRYLFGHK